MTVGERTRQLRQQKSWTLRDLAAEVHVGFTYLSRVENERLNFGDYPSDALIHRLADALEVDEEELLILAKRVLKRPDVFRVLAECDDRTLDKLMSAISEPRQCRKRQRGASK